MSDQTPSGDWPNRAAAHNTIPPSSLRVSEQLEEELRLARKKRMPTFMSLGIGVGLAILAYAVFAMQQGSFADAGAKVDADISEVKASGVDATNKAVDATGNAARNAGQNIDNALDRATRSDGEPNAPAQPPPPQKQ